MMNRRVLKLSKGKCAYDINLGAGMGELTLVPLQVRRSKRPAVSTVQQSEAAISLVHHITSHLQVKGTHLKSNCASTSYLCLMNECMTLIVME
jgi:hypothetical protein